MTSPVERLVWKYLALNQPWRSRVSRFLRRSAEQSADTLGIVVFAEFMGQGVVGLEFNPNVKGAWDAYKLKGAVKKEAERFGKKANRLLLKRLGNEAAVDDVVQDYMTRLLGRGLQLLPRTPLAKAEAYVLKSLVNASTDILRKLIRERRRNYDDGDLIEKEEPQALGNLNAIIPEPHVTRVLQELKALHPRAQSFFQLALEGHSSSEIARAWGVSPAYVSKWVRKYGPGIQRVVRRHTNATSRADSVNRD